MRFTQTCVVLGMLAVPALASAQIKEPGNHPLYKAELEPHVIVEWADDYAPCTSDALGVGFRAAIPIVDNGPIPKINNNLAIGFGLDYAHSSVGYGCNAYYVNNVYVGNGFSSDVWSLPVVAQWNFFLLPKVSVFGEAGLVLQHFRHDNGYGAVTCNNGVCNGDLSENHLNPSFSVGGRFLISDSVGFLVRLGYPYFSAGVSILL